MDISSDMICTLGVKSNRKRRKKRKRMKKVGRNGEERKREKRGEKGESRGYILEVTRGDISRR